MTGIELCAGVGGLSLGVKIAFANYKCVAAVESNYEAASRFHQRFPKAVLFRDVVGFDGRPFRDRLDCIVAGWPCQPHSIAGGRGGTQDERWIWGDIARIIGEIRPLLFFGENVAGLLRDTDSDSGRSDLEDESDYPMGGMGTVLRDLADMGYLSVWGRLLASSVGASSGRPRVFLLACRDTPGLQGSESRQLPGTIPEHEGRAAKQLRGAQLAEPKTFPPGPESFEEWNAVLASLPGLAPTMSAVTKFLTSFVPAEDKSGIPAEAESRLHGLAHGVARWLDGRRQRIQCGGNGCVPLQAAVAFTVLARRLGIR